MKKYTTVQGSICCLMLMLSLSIKAQSYHTLLTTGYYIGSGNKSKAIDNYFLKASLPLKLKNGNYVLLNPDVHRQTFYFDTMQTLTTYKTGLVMAYMKMMKKGSLIAILNTGNNYSSGSMSSKSMQVGGGFLITRIVNKNLKIKYGMFGNREFFGPLLVPLFGLDCKLNDKMRVYGVLPQNMKLEVKYQSKIRYGLMFETPLNTYRIEQTQSSRYLDQRQILGGCFFDIYLNKNIVIQAQIKQPFFNSQKIFNSNQMYGLSVLGVGFSGTRKTDTIEQAYMRHSTIAELSLNYRIETE